MSVEKLIVDHMETWTSALQTRSTAGRGSSGKIDLYGIKKLRELILELAVRGKLVPQDPNDEPASELLKRIAAEKAELVKQGKIKKQKPLPEISEEEKPFELPEGWEWVRLGCICKKLTDGSHNPPKDAGNGYPMLSSQNILDGYIDIDNPSRYVCENDFHKENARTLIQKNDILLTIVGSIGRSAVVLDDCSFVLQRSVAVINTSLYPIFISNFFKSVTAQRYFIEYGKGTAQKGIYLGQLSLMPVPVPSLHEQKRISNKIQEIMSHCDQLEQQSLTSLDAHQQLVETLLGTLTDSQNAEELAENWARISEHFDTLFTTEASVDALKQTILQLAVMGKLVPQDPNDEPASELLKRIAQEKAQLVKEGKIKKHSPVEPLGTPCSIPESWMNIVVQDFADIRLGSTPDRSEKKYWNGDIPWVSSGEVANNVILDTNEKITIEGFNNSSTSIIPAGSLLMAIIGQGKTRGQTAILGIDACTNQNVAAFVFNKNLVNPKYVWIWAKSKYQSHREDGHGGAQPALNGKKVRSFIFPLPPTKEQLRIVNMVDNLNNILDKLNFQIQSAQQTQLHLADALTDAAVN
ncbi:restriction endonuclease subunit S [Escherichia coli]|uniref:restriction endonuclease subunit S n=1 Tax=Escherichia coli TaxID=562 RepID=UPI00107BA668|nr:restriction endonuclease subunit S [Escherichia coli]EAB9736277.1 restriction endonuclease subunit S [Escherichia coli]EFB7570908.1 restriction endonuclease subunit S [Escherichia coli]MCF7270394.1 restriction endonuclease subunit S [Escherichia coli]HBB0121840.1 restriction endonuclease subunit S [Escherichia coli]